jgi:1-deoxyxylulose-5-phosphate synthase
MMAKLFDWQAPGNKHYRMLGRTGVKVSKLCLGAMNFGGSTSEEDGIKITHAALDAGINFIDTANVYNAGESERIVGKALKGKRHQVVLATKFYNNLEGGPNDWDGSRYHIISACEDSLRRLNTDHIDLYQMHRPSFVVPLDETLRALDDLITQGKVRYIGTSNFPAWWLTESLWTSDKLNLNRVVSEQPPYNFLDRRIENELVPMCQRHDIAILPWSPIAAGILAGRYQRGAGMPKGSRGERNTFFQERANDRVLDVADEFFKIAQENGLTGPQLATLWVMEQPGITAPIVGPRTMEHLETYLSVADMELTDEMIARLDALNPPCSIISDFHNSSNWMKMRINHELAAT